MCDFLIYHEPREIQRLPEIEKIFENEKLDIQFLEDIKGVGIGYSNLVLMNTKGDVVMIGPNDKYFLGTTNTKQKFNLLELDEKVSKVRAYGSLCAVLSKGRIFFWGTDTIKGEQNKKPNQVKINKGINIVDIQLGSRHLIALSDDDLVYSCGHNDNAQVDLIFKI